MSGGAGGRCTALGLGLGLPLLLAGCLGNSLRPVVGLNQRLGQLGSSQGPAIAGGWLALIAGNQGRSQVQLIDLQRGLPVPLMGLNRPDAQPLSVASDARGERLALVRHRLGRTEVVLYRRNVASLEPIPLQPDGVPRRVALDPEGRNLAVEVSRNGLWQIDLITLP